MRSLFSILMLIVCAATAAAQDARFANKRVPFEPGFRMYFIVDMEGMGSAVHTREVIAGNEGERYRTLTGPDYWEHYRGLLTDEVNAAIAGARLGGARSFVVNEGHGGNLFANVLPWQLDQDAILIRGYPKPMVMSTGIDSTFGAFCFHWCTRQCRQRRRHVTHLRVRPLQRQRRGAQRAGHQCVGCG
jgi:D-aminopeptidase